MVKELNKNDIDSVAKITMNLQTLSDLIAVRVEKIKSMLDTPLLSFSLEYQDPNRLMGLMGELEDSFDNLLVYMKEMKRILKEEENI